MIRVNDVDHDVSLHWTPVLGAVACYDVARRIC
jgi:hypothetical protein